PRFAVMVAVLSILTVPAALRRISGKATPLLLLPALIVPWYGVKLVREYRAYDKELSSFSFVLDRIPPGGKLLGLLYDRSSKVMHVDSALVGLAAYYPVERRSPTSFVPIVYCGMRHMPCRPVGDFVPGPNPWAPRTFNPSQALSYFDYFLVRRGPASSVIFGNELPSVELVTSRGEWSVFRAKR